MNELNEQPTCSIPALELPNTVINPTQGAALSSPTSPTDPFASSVGLMTTGKVMAKNDIHTTRTGTLPGSGRVARLPAALASSGVSGKPIRVDFRKTFVYLKKNQDLASGTQDGHSSNGRSGNSGNSGNSENSGNSGNFGNPGTTENEDLENLPALERDLLHHELGFFEAILRARPNSVEEFKATFARYRTYFACNFCQELLKSDGKAGNTLRLACKSCGYTCSFSQVLDAIQETIKLRFEADEMGNDQTITDDETANEQPAETTKRRRETLTDSSSSEEYDLMTDFNGTQTPLDEPMRTMPTISDLIRVIDAMRQEMQTMKAENAELRRLLGAKPGQPEHASAPTSTGNKDGTKMVSYASIAALNPPPRPSKYSRQATRPTQRRLNDDELERALKGLPIKPPKKVTALYATGLRKCSSIRQVKELLKANFDVALRNIFSIDFIGKSLTEFHVADDYADEFRRRMTSRNVPITFVDADPLDDGLLRYSTVANKQLEAARKYHARLSKRLEQSPIAAHRAFLKTEMARAQCIIDSVPRSSTQAAAPAQPNDQ